MITTGYEISIYLERVTSWQGETGGDSSGEILDRYEFKFPESRILEVQELFEQLAELAKGVEKG